LRVRQQVFGPDEVIDIAEGSEEFWRWYAKTVRFNRAFRLSVCADVPPYPPSTGKSAIWFSGGVESTYTFEQIRHLQAEILRIEDFPLFETEHRRFGQIHFLCAAIASDMGYSYIYLGVERSDFLLAENPFSRQYVERSCGFLKEWSRYQPEHRLVSVCSELHKEQIIEWLFARNIPITGTCDRYRDGRWCGDCYKCFEAFYTAKSVGIDLGIPLRRRAFAQYYGEYRRYVDSGFTDNFNNAYQHYLRLQVMYHLKFEPDLDCRI
jgi:hypothetical protein